jgi:hypothetical protein
MEKGQRDLIGRQLQIAPLRVAVDVLLQGSNLDIATSGDALQKRCTELLEDADKASAQVQPTALDSGCLLSFGLQLHLLASTILQPRHAADMSRFFKGITLVSQPPAHAAKTCSGLMGVQSRSSSWARNCTVAFCL